MTGFGKRAFTRMAVAGNRKRDSIGGAEYANYSGGCETSYPAPLRLMQKHRNLER